jgi:hypothetical protein
MVGERGLPWAQDVRDARRQIDEVLQACGRFRGHAGDRHFWSHAANNGESFRCVSIHCKTSLSLDSNTPF